MELDSLLESSPQPIAYHIQVNICHDINLALSFLHFNGIIHRDLSSNNVLLHGSILAKVTDFGMAKLGDLNPQATRYTFGDSMRAAQQKIQELRQQLEQLQQIVREKERQLRQMSSESRNLKQQRVKLEDQLHGRAKQEP